MTDFKAKMHQIRFRLGLRPRSRWGAYSAPPDPLAGFGGPTSKERERDGRGGRGGEDRGEEGRRGKGRGGEEKGHEPPPTIWRKFTPMECSRDKPPFSFVTGHDSTMCDTIWVQTWPWVRFIHGLGWVGSEIFAYEMGWVGFSCQKLIIFSLP